MKYKLILKEDLKEEISDVVVYYEFQQQNLGYKFLDALEKTLLILKQHPLTYQITYNTFRQIRIVPFPFVLFFEVSENTVVVYQLFNNKRNPTNRFKKNE